MSTPNSDGTEPLTPLLSTAIGNMTYPDLTERKTRVISRLSVIGTDDATSTKKKASASSRRKAAATSANKDNSSLIPYDPKTDTHWDFCMKEMMWLAADFQTERKRQISLGKKVAAAVRQFHKTKETRRVRELAEAELKRRRLAGKIGREVKGFWTKIERVISYKQKLEADVERRKAMNRQLVALVKQTERYGVSLARQNDVDDGTDSDASFMETDEDEQRRKRRRRITIEEALAAGGGLARRKKGTITDYSRIDISNYADEFYGESTSADSGSDGSFVPDDDIDDETTLLEAEASELMERNRENLGSDSIAPSFAADEEELRKLQEETEMDIDAVLERLKEEAGDNDDMDIESVQSVPERASRRVSFAKSVEGESSPPKAKRRVAARQIVRPVDPGNDADDDADASDVEDFVDTNSDGSDEFEADLNEVDDETTIEIEERLGRDMSAEDEIALLQRESTMSVEELRQKYAFPNETSQDLPPDNDETAPVPDATGTYANPSQLWEADDSLEEDEFRPLTSAEEIDDETTIDAEERLGRDMTHEQEISLLQKESEIPVEELRRMYAAMEEADFSEDENDSSGANGSEPASSTAADLLAEGDIDDVDNDEFSPDETTAVDDETTIEAEERLGREMSYEEEIDLLKRESEMSVEDLRRMYSEVGATAPDPSANEPALQESMFEEDDNLETDEYRPDAEIVDDETTLEAEEKLGREMSVEDEIAILKRESETSIEELRKMYGNVDHNTDEESPVEADEVIVSSEADIDSKRRRTDSDRDTTEDEGLAALQALNASEERAKSTLASRPFLISKWVKLRAYQQIGLNWLVSVQSRRLNGILADEMGLGKTLQTISLLAYLAAYKGIWGPHLIIVPTSCIVNWETEFKRFCPGLKVLCYYGSAKRRKELRTGWTKANWHHVIVTSYQLVVQDSFAFKRKKWYYLILDEAHNIKNFESQRWQTLINFNTQRRLLLTGTPLQNNLMELWSLLHFLMPHVFRSRKQFSYWFSNPMNSIIEGNSRGSDDLIRRLHGIIRPFVLRRLKKDVETQMPGKFEHIVKCKLSRRQMFLYEEFMARSSTRQALKKGGNFMGMMNVLMQLRKVCNHPDLFEPRSVVTPFVMDTLKWRTAACILDAVKPTSFGDSLSQSLLSFLWTAGSDEVRPIDCLQHDATRAEQLHRLEVNDLAYRERISNIVLEEPLPTSETGPGLACLLRKVHTAARKDIEDTFLFQKRLNSRRCRSFAFPYPASLLDMADIVQFPLERIEVEEVQGSKIMSTPASLLDMRRNQQERADDLDDLMKKFVFCVPKAGAHRPTLVATAASTSDERIESSLNTQLASSAEEYFKPFRKAQARLSSFFPDNKLVQFDAGKLQTLAELLRDLKSGGHRALIFTQMSKMLDILEAFLNLNGHTYLRLDGSTGVDRRQRLMDRFNTDPKVFCFILSTRSGGLGINLTGADTVIFYDSDWNPQIDAQAQDRAHRIGQTRDVHIYRLITEHSIEENILLKSQQKKKLDLLVMDEGKFDASAPTASDKPEESTDVYSAGGLRNILGVSDEAGEDESSIQDKKKETDNLTKEQLEKAMASLEDEDDVLAMKDAQKEAAEELQEFDETIEIKTNQEGTVDGDDEGAGRPKEPTATPGVSNGKNTDTTGNPDEESQKGEEDMTKEFEAWQSKVGLDASAIASSLSPTERYALQFRETVDPFYSLFAVMEYKRKMEAEEMDDDVIDIDELEKTKAAEERRAIRDGDLLGTRPHPEDLIRQRHLYLREKARLKASQKRKTLTGENWITKVDSLSKTPYWYNTDTGEATWDKPKVLLELEAEEVAHLKKWNAMSMKPLVHIMEYLIPWPERMHCSAVCRQWRVAANDISFVRHVFPVEMSSLTRPDRQIEHNHYRTIAEAVSAALPGDTIELGDGHYWAKAPGLLVDMPLRIVGDEHDPSHVVIELMGTVKWNGRAGWMEGITFRRPRISTEEQQSTEILRLGEKARLDMTQCVLDNHGNGASVTIIAGPNAKGSWHGSEIKGSASGCGLVVESSSHIQLSNCMLENNKEFGLLCRDTASFKLAQCSLAGNLAGGLHLLNGSRGQCVKCRFLQSGEVPITKEPGSSCVPCSGNTMVVTSPENRKAPVGFRLEVAREESNTS